MLPKIKKKITSFLVEEEGKISKQSMLTLGSFLSAAVIGGVLATKEVAAQHTNNLSVSYTGDTATGTHQHHSSHSNHSNHSNHANHSSGDDGDGGDSSDGDCY